MPDKSPTSQHSSVPLPSSPYAKIDWNEKGQPISREFDDVYFSPVNGLKESHHVFLEPNHLSQRWQALSINQQAANQKTFVIGETGFGTGLNFLAAWNLWDSLQNNDPNNYQSNELHFVSVEKYPLHKSDLQQALALWPELAPLAQQLIDSYPTITGPGFHRMNFDGGRVRLTLIIDDAVTGLEQLLYSNHPLHSANGPKVDAWFLDGFMPAKNPEMWREELFKVVGQLSKKDTTLATFTAASVARQGLLSVGFEVEKLEGFGPKRHMMRADMQNPLPAPDKSGFPKGAFNATFAAPWSTDRDTIQPESQRSIVIGGGLAGCHTARALANRGWQVTVIEQHGELATEGSSNPQGVLYAKLSPKQEPLAQFNLAALQFAQRLYTPLWKNESPDFGQQCGVLQLAHTDKERELQQSLQQIYGETEGLVQLLHEDQTSGVAGIALQQSGLFFPSAGWINPPSLCHYLTDHPNITVTKDSSVATLERQNQHWQLLNAQKQVVASASVVVIATAHHTIEFPQTGHLPLKPIRGQISYLPATQRSRELKTVLCSEGYIAPAHNNQHCLGATFNLKDQSRELRAADHQHNLNNLETYTPELANCFDRVDTETLPGRVAFRCSTRDYLPIAGPAPDFNAFLDDYALLRKNAKSSIPEAGQYWPGLYLNVGHGSRGLTYAPLCAELVAAQITHTPLPMGRDLTTALNPARFIIRDLMRNKV